MAGITAFDQRVYELTRLIPRGERRELAGQMRRASAERSVAQAIARNPFMIIVPATACWRRATTRQEAPFRHLRSVEGTCRVASKTLFDVLRPVASPRPHN